MKKPKLLKTISVTREQLAALNWPETDEACFCPACGAICNKETGKCKHSDDCWFGKALAEGDKP